MEYLSGADRYILKRWSEEESDLGFIEISENLLVGFFYTASYPSLNCKWNKYVSSFVALQGHCCKLPNSADQVYVLGDSKG